MEPSAKRKSNRIGYSKRIGWHSELNFGSLLESFSLLTEDRSVAVEVS